MRFDSDSHRFITMTAITQNPSTSLHEQLDKVHIAAGGLPQYTSFKKEVVSDAEKQVSNYPYFAEGHSELTVQRRIFKTSYEPSPEWWAANQAEYKKPETDPLPEGFPAQVDNTSVWDGKVLINQRESPSPPPRR